MPVTGNFPKRRAKVGKIPEKKHPEGNFSFYKKE
jgi:hypothetical protein